MSNRLSRDTLYFVIYTDVETGNVVFYAPVCCARRATIQGTPLWNWTTDVNELELGSFEIEMTLESEIPAYVRLKVVIFYRASLYGGR